MSEAERPKFEKLEHAFGVGETELPMPVPVRVEPGEGWMDEEADAVFDAAEILVQHWRAKYREQGEENFLLAGLEELNNYLAGLSKGQESDRSFNDPISAIGGVVVSKDKTRIIRLDKRESVIDTSLLEQMVGAWLSFLKPAEQTPPSTEPEFRTWTGSFQLDDMSELGGLAGKLAGYRDLPIKGTETGTFDDMPGVEKPAFPRD